MWWFRSTAYITEPGHSAVNLKINEDENPSQPVSLDENGIIMAKRCEVGRSLSCYVKFGHGNADFPSCWSISQKVQFCNKNKWLLIKQKKLGVIHVWLLALSVQINHGVWKFHKIVGQLWSLAYGDFKEKQLKSFHKSICW